VTLNKKISRKYPGPEGLALGESLEGNCFSIGQVPIYPVFNGEIEEIIQPFSFLKKAKL